MNWIFFNPIKGEPWGDSEKWMIGLCHGLSLHGDQCVVVPPPSGQSPHQTDNDFKPDVVLVKGFRAARLARRSWPNAAIGINVPSVHNFANGLVARWIGNTCIDRILTDHHTVRLSLLQHSWVLPGKIAVYSIENMTETVRSAMQHALHARQDQRTPTLTSPLGRHWLRSSTSTVEPDSPIWDESVESELVSRSPHAIVRRIQYANETVYMKRFLGHRLSLRRLGLRRPVAADNFRTAARLTLRGAAVVPHLAAGWNFGASRGDESLLITGTILHAVTLDKWSRSQASRLAGHNVLWRELASWLAHLHGAGVACHDLKASNVLVHQLENGSLEFTLLDLDNCQLRPFQSTDHDVHRNFHQLFRSFQTIASPPAILRFLAVYRRVRGLNRRRMRRLAVEVERRLHRRGTGYAEILAAYRAGRGP
jgi:hypothetical protein